MGKRQGSLIRSFALTDTAAGTSRWNPGEAIAAWIFPGLGHYLIGEKKRAIILAVCIGSLWVSGLLMGGVGVIHWAAPDKAPFLWFCQTLTAPSLVINTGHNRQWFTRIAPTEHQPASPRDTNLSQRGLRYRPSFNRVEEQGILYTAIAGLLNLMAMIDVLYHDPQARRRHAQQHAGQREEAASPATNVSARAGTTETSGGASGGTTGGGGGGGGA